MRVVGGARGVYGNLKVVTLNLDIRVAGMSSPTVGDVVRATDGASQLVVTQFARVVLLDVDGELRSGHHLQGDNAIAAGSAGYGYSVLTCGVTVSSICKLFAITDGVNIRTISSIVDGEAQGDGTVTTCPVGDDDLRRIGRRGIGLTVERPCIAIASGMDVGACSATIYCKMQSHRRVTASSVQSGRHRG